MEMENNLCKQKKTGSVKEERFLARFKQKLQNGKIYLAMSAGQRTIARRQLEDFVKQVKLQKEAKIVVEVEATTAENDRGCKHGVDGNGNARETARERPRDGQVSNSRASPVKRKDGRRGSCWRIKDSKLKLHILVLPFKSSRRIVA